MRKVKFKKIFNSKFSKGFIVIMLFCFLVVFSCYLFDLLFMPHIKLKGNSVVVINYKEKYKEPGYSAYYRNKLINKNVKVNGSINNKKLGTYSLEYIVRKGRLSRRVSRVVKVVDKSSPDISLVNGDLVSVCPNHEYDEDGYKAIDNYDGDITNKVKVIKGKDFISYVVADKSGNKKSVKRKLVYEDKTNPVISLNGSDTMYIFVGDTFVDPLYTASDNCDLDITNKVVVSGSVNNSSANTSILTYSVSDNSGNSSSVSRKVVVSNRGANGVIYLTFDDGPKSGTTDVILDILKEEGVKATFFVTNGGPDNLIQREYNEGHTIGLHTASHDYAYVYSSMDNYFNDLNTVSSRVKNLTGYDSKIIRFPGGSSNTISRRYASGIMSSLTNEVINRGYKYYDWNISSGDAAGGNHAASEIYNNVVSRLSHDRANMVLMHDIKTYTRDALRDIIRYGKANGYSFSAINYDTEMVRQKVNN